MEGDQSLDFNFWPSFADLRLSIVLILIFMTSIVMVESVQETWEANEIKEKQEQVAIKISNAYGIERPEGKEDYYWIKIPSENGFKNRPDIEFRGKYHLQSIIFYDTLLFSTGKWELGEAGKDAIQKVGSVLLANLNDIESIEITEEDIGL